MVVVVLEKCPLALRGDLTKWLQEISPGVYVGQVNARVRERLWERVCSESKSGRATMVFTARNEQRYDFHVHNTTWEPIDFDGIKLMMRPSPSHIKLKGEQQGGLGNVSKRRGGIARSKSPVASEPNAYVVLDLETTGLDPTKDEIVEIGAIKVLNGVERDSFQRLIKTSSGLSANIEKLTGLRSSDLDTGVTLDEALTDFQVFAANNPLVAHNAEFDYAFLQEAADSLDLDEFENEVFDTLALARKRYPSMSTYKLGPLCAALNIDVKPTHRALDDARAAREVFLKLIEI